MSTALLSPMVIDTGDKEIISVLNEMELMAWDVDHSAQNSTQYKVNEWFIFIIFQLVFSEWNQHEQLNHEKWQYGSGKSMHNFSSLGKNS